MFSFITGLLRAVCGWWHHATIGTLLFTSMKGEKVGEDDQGNEYYRERNGDRRWVIYNGEIEASRIPPEWHAWLHHTVDENPVDNPPVVKAWEKDHLPNLTGSVDAYFPSGSLNETGQRAKTTGDYEAWTPGN